MRILIVGCGFDWADVGGAQRILCEFSDAMIQRGHEVLMLFENKRQRTCFYPVNPKIELCDLYKEYGVTLTSCHTVGQKVIREVLRAVGKTYAVQWGLSCGRRAAKNKRLNARIKEFEPDIAVSFFPEATMAALNLNVKIPLISMLHFDPKGLGNRSPKILEVLARVQNQVLLPGMISVFQKYVPGARVVDIPNAVRQYEKAVDLSAEKPTYKIITIGRISAEKHQDILIEAFSKIAGDFPAWNLELWGQDDGWKPVLKKQIQRTGMERRIFFKGTTPNVEEIHKNADLFVLTSFQEGFCLGMAEAMSAGIPAIAFGRCIAASSLIQDQISGVLADDNADSLAEKMRELMEDKEKRVNMGKAAHLAMTSYSPQKVYDRWEALMRRVIKENAV